MSRIGLKPAVVLAGFVLVAMVALAFSGLGFWAGQRAQAQGSAPEPGSEQDPLVSKSYVDDYVQLRVVTLAAGQQLIGDGGTEIILRGGKTTAIGTAAGGLSDLTGGKDLVTGVTVPPNHLLLVPRSDGRGVKAVTDAILLVRGPHSIRQQQ